MLILVGWRTSVQVQRLGSDESSTVSVFGQPRHKVENAVFAVAVVAVVVVHLKLPILEKIKLDYLRFNFQTFRISASYSTAGQSLLMLPVE